jgi:tRNA-binding EMAP/Myf-like protein
MQDKLVVIITNLKPRVLAGWNSHGMVLVTESEDN